MAKLTAASRNALPTSTFALPARRYPIEDANHARNALARVAQHGTPASLRRLKTSASVGSSWTPQTTRLG